MKIYKITEASEYLGVSINTLKTLSNNERYKMIGNGWIVDVIAHILKGIL